LLPFVKKIIGYANTYTMVQVIIKTTAPGIPDVYQGCELWDLSYVDPDNRRPVDFNLRKRLLQEIRKREKENNGSLLKWAKDNYEQGAQKLLVTTKILHLRKNNNDLFVKGDYIPVYTEGSDRIVIAFFRRYENNWILVVLPLGIVENTGKDLTVILPPEAPSKWRNIFTGECEEGHAIDVKKMLSKFPVALMTMCD
jgi:(1->4)-alpha-D-glucan 1-alpha-D-glucosylmutase